MHSVRVTHHAKQVQYVEPQEDHTFLAIISATVILVYFNLSNILPKSGTFPLRTPCIHCSLYHTQIDYGLVLNPGKERAFIIKVCHPCCVYN